MNTLCGAEKKYGCSLLWSGMVFWLNFCSTLY
jgi:hypothetical protein